MLLLITAVVVAAFVLSVTAAVLLSTHRAASLDDGSMVDVVLDRRARPRVGGGRPV